MRRIPRPRRPRRATAGGLLKDLQGPIAALLHLPRPLSARGASKARSARDVPRGVPGGFGLWGGGGGVREKNEAESRRSLEQRVTHIMGVYSKLYSLLINSIHWRGTLFLGFDDDKRADRLDRLVRFSERMPKEIHPSALTNTQTRSQCIV